MTSMSMFIIIIITVPLMILKHFVKRVEDVLVVPRNLFVMECGDGGALRIQSQSVSTNKTLRCVKLSVAPA
jgi:hypothetical protein